jgi:RNA polymerase sigma-70 factor, ECF subfamily
MEGARYGLQWVTSHPVTDLEQYRRELTGYCYRMLGSGFEAEDAVQETMVRAWKGMDSYEGRAALRTWLYRIATNVCVDMLRGSQRRARPMDLGPSSSADAVVGAGLPESTWVLPIPDSRVLPAGGDPAEVAELRDSIRLAFVTALQHLPPRQRAVLVLREVLRWEAAEVAQLLETTVASVNSALQRARATLASVRESSTPVIEADQRALLDSYVAAFEAYDMTRLASLLRDDAVLSMPPLTLWLRGPAEIVRWHLGQGSGCRGSRLLPTSANGSYAFGSYRPDAAGGHAAWSLQVLELSEDRIIGLNSFLDTELFTYFGLPAALPAR